MDKLLPIGSIVYLNRGRQKLMILNRGPQAEIDNQLNLFDYSAIPFPMGMIPEQVTFFNSEDIDKVVFEGYSDEDEDKFQEIYQQWLETEGGNIPKGNIMKIRKDLEA